MKPITLIIMDGFGISDEKYGNAIVGNCPNFDRLTQKYAKQYTTINASGMDVGLPDGQMGNSEVGHTNIGAGRVVYQELTRITKAIMDESFYKNETLIKAIEHCKKNNSALHLMGLMSDGGVHSHNSHLFALLELAKRQNFNNVFIHCFMDGRDVSPTSGACFVDECVQMTQKIGVGKVASVMGRYYAMDRDTRWERVELAYNAMTKCEGEYFENPVKGIEQSYKAEVTDEFIKPFVCTKDCKVSDNDSVIFFNFRPDRAREITRAFVDPNFTGFERKMINTFFVTMTSYDVTIPNVSVAFVLPTKLENTLGEYLSKNNLKQLRIAETTKYAHVTFFFNGGVEEVYAGEDRVLIETPKVATFDLKPEMSAYEVTDAVLEKINANMYDVIILNFANCDMVGHTSLMDATVKAVKTVDECMNKVLEATLKMGGTAIVTADHGNADKLFEADGSPFTAHTTNVVPFLVAGYDCTVRQDGEKKLADIAPTILKIMGLPIPSEMDGNSLI